MEVTLRHHIPGDLQWLVAAHGELYAGQFQFDAEFTLDIARKLEIFLARSDDFSRIFIAENGTERIGSIAVSLQAESTAFINFFMVTESFQGRGVARHLLEKVLCHAGENGAGLVRLETYSCLTAARNLYQGYGFSCVEVQTHIEKYGQVFDREFWEKVIKL